MKNKFLFGLITLSLTVILITSCSKVPQVEIDAANSAIEEARTAGAEIYVQTSFVQLQDSMKAVMTGIEAQKSKFFKNYSASKEQLASVTQLANEVKQQTEIRKEELKKEIQTTISEVKTLIDANKQLILEAPKGKEGTTALVAIKGELTTIEAIVVEANTMFDSGNLIGSLDKAKVAKEKAASINTELKGVIAKYKANVKYKKV
ncbi:MAG: hypothetical protein JXB17_07055 [Bacteroidales bacterium]|nr:hypothetical protein [Bacteroidales bacterium]